MRRPSTAEQLFSGAGEMSRLMRELAWDKSSLGDPAGWPESLRSTLGLCLDSAFPIAIYWGPQLALLYNDAWRPILGDKHPWALGRPAQEVWPEIWGDIEPVFAQVRAAGKGVFNGDSLLAMNRYGYVEECYFDYTFNPIRAAREVGGIFNVVIETTYRVIGARRARALRDFATRVAPAKRIDEAIELAAASLSEHRIDVPFALLYRLMPGTGVAQLARAVGLEAGSPAAPVEALLDKPVPWPLGQAVRQGRPERVGDLRARLGPLPGGPWPDAPREALVLPVGVPGHATPPVVLVAGVSPRRALDTDYEAFLASLASHMAGAMADAEAFDAERRRAEALAELDRAKTAFFSNVSHEFRTPLTLMLGPVQDILAKPVDGVLPENRELLAVVQRNGQRLLKLVNTLLDFARIEAGRAQASYEPTDLAALTADLASNFRAACERAALRLEVDCPGGGEPAWVDREMWEKIVLNLLSNAFKFTFEGGMAVATRETPLGFELEVRDTGTGIPEESLPRMFERFYRVEGARGRSHEGSGIGLALVQELVKLHGGSIAVSSVPGRGATFTVTVPKGNAHLPPERIRAARDAASTAVRAGTYVDEAFSWLPGETRPVAARPHGKRVLLADDNADMREYARRLLGEHYEVEAVPDGEAALAAARARKPDLLVTDIMMPRLDGFGLIRAMRADAALREVPIIALSARAGEEARIEGLDKGADEYLTKPFGARELLVRTETLLRSTEIRRQAEQALRDSEARLRAIVETTPECVKIVAADGTLRQMNASGLAMVGAASAEQVVGGCVYDLIAPEHRARFREFNEKICRGERGVLAFDIVGMGGRRRHVETRAAPLREPDGSLAQLALTRDVTEREEAEAALRRSEARYRTLLGLMPAAVYTCEAPSGVISYYNERAAELWGRSPRAGDTDARFCGSYRLWRTDGTLLPHHQTPMAVAIREGRAFRDQEVVIERPDGSRITVLVNIDPLRDEQGRLTGGINVFHDITAARAAAEALRESEERFRALTSATSEVVYRMSPDWTEMHYLRGREFIADTREPSRSWLDKYIHPEDQPIVREAIERAVRTKSVFELEHRVIRTDGTLGWTHSRAVPILDGRGGITDWFGAASDITLRKSAEETLRETDRRKDEFIAMLSHELRNPLAPLRSSLHLLRMTDAGGPAEKPVYDMMERQVNQLVRLVDDLLEMSRISRGAFELRRERVELAAVVRSAVETSDPLIRDAGHQLALSLAPEPLAVEGDPVRLAQIVANLLNNAARYTERGGRIAVDVRREGASVVIAVSDNGVGIAPEALPRLFEMFSRGERSTGLGIGLSLARRLAQMHGGSLEVASGGAGKGSTFTLRLPLASPGAAESTPLHPVAARIPPRRVLVVDDNRDAAESLGMVLKVLGADVRIACDGREALEAFSRYDPAVVLLDIGMPGMDGYEIARALRERYPGRRAAIVALTGWGQEEDRRRAREAGFDHHLVKPAEIHTLQALLSTLGSVAKARQN